ncbi:hypothetical protein [uncultured Allisonella sp.]|uniref:hypothetical protein n=1 Tax=Allisonella histaminiformans TaxID=209880 RepID=UPI002599EDC9|nr:hypothetical protein [uncultured Allisonella sp.]
MKYKSLYCLLLACALTRGVCAVSSVSANAALSSLQPTDTQSAILRQTRDSIRLGLLLLGEDNLHAGRYVQGGTENYAADGTTLIGRTYSLPLFGENTQAGTLYDSEGKVSTVTIQLDSPKAKPYSRSLQRLYGNPTNIQTRPSEGGATWEEWSLGKNNIRLYQEYGLTALELTRKANNHFYDSESWIPASIQKQYAETKPCPELEKAIADYYDIRKEERTHTSYVYNKVDLNGDGTDEIFAVITGPYTSGTGGDSAVWGRLYKGKFQIYQSFTLIRTPIIITKDATNGLPNGARSIIVRQSGGGAPAELIQYVSHDGEYVPEPCDSLDKVKGTAILCTAPGTDAEKLTLTHF